MISSARETPTRIRRSELSTPGHSEKMIAKAAASDADMVFLDLEDAVAPAVEVPSRTNIALGFDDAVVFDVQATEDRFITIREAL